MRHSNYSVMVPQGQEFGETGHVRLRHGTVYTIRVGNHDWRCPCDAEVVVDGKPVGTWRLEPGQSASLEHPVDDTGRFTFHRSDSAEAEAGGAAGVAKAERGLVAVTFRACVPAPRPVFPKAVRRGPGGQSAGGWQDARPFYGLPSYGPPPDPLLRTNETYTSNHVADGGTTETCYDPSEMCRGVEGAPHRRLGNVTSGITTLTGESAQSYGTAERLPYDPDVEPVVVTLRLVCDDRPAVRPLKAVRGNPVPDPVE